jgi:DNA-binding transcriptional LysR family regulator
MHDRARCRAVLTQCIFARSRVFKSNVGSGYKQLMTMSMNATVLANRLVSRARLRHLQVLMRVAELGTVKRAAEAIGLTQPAVTHALADLERLLECILFLRHARGMQATPAGLALVPVARRILATLHEGAEQVVALAGTATSAVRVAAIDSALSGLLGRAIPEFIRAYPHILVQVTQADPVEQAAMVEHREVDMFVCRAPSVTPAGWRFMPLLEDRFVVVAAPGHRLLRRSNVGLEQLVQADWLIAPADSPSRRAFDMLFADQPERPRTCGLISRVPSLFWSMLTSEKLVSILPLSFVRQMVDDGLLRELPLDRELPFDPIGVLVPVAEIGDSARELVCFLEAFTDRESSKAVASPATRTAKKAAGRAVGQDTIIKRCQN